MAQWLPHYHLPWLVNDVIAGITLVSALESQHLTHGDVLINSRESCSSRKTARRKEKKKKKAPDLFTVLMNHRQGLAYARIATIPIEHGLYSSWIP